MKLNQFAVYRVDQQTAGKALWHLPYQEARQQNVSITVENYRVISIHEMQEEEKVADIWKRMKKQCEVSDVLVLNRDGEINCYYVDENYPQYLAGFIRINTSGALITMETENYQIDGKKGNWIATDTIIINGKQFYLMEHQVYRDQAQGVILDAYGKMVVEECKKFDEKTKQKIHNYIQQQAPLNSVEQLKQDGKIRLEHYQKFYQNGTYERSRESGTEANYDMVDGLVNNQKKNPEKISNARSNKQTPRNQQDGKPKKRRSVIKRLHQKQIAIARRSGKPIPKYLDQQGIIRNVKEIKGYVDEIVTASREDFMNLEVSMGEYYLSEVMKVTENYYKDKLSVIHTEFQVDEISECLVKGDKERMVEVLQNVMENAIKYGDGKSIRISFGEEENCKLVHIENSGCNLKKEELSNIFDSFYRGSNSNDVKGSGLGLYICKKLMRKMDGEIFAEMNGDVFCVTIVIKKA